MSLHRSKGGKVATKHTEPNEREGFALSVAAAMMFAKLCDSQHPQFFTSIGQAMKHCEGT